MADQVQGANGSVFISYSRKDKVFVKKLNDALDSAGIHAWVDWEGIRLASDWMQTISAAIQDTDALLFVVSPDSLKSKICRKVVRIWELSAIPFIPKDQLISIACSHLVSNFSQEDWTNLFGEEEYRLHCANLP